MKKPLISIVIPTKNSEKTLEKCLESIKEQTYQNYELIIVDAFSSDRTMEIASNYTDKIFRSGAKMAGARNEGFSRAEGMIFLSLDSDMIVEKNVLEEIVKKIDDYGGLILPEAGYGDTFISKCKDLEKRCYMGEESIESVRALTCEAFVSMKGYDADLLFGEDRDLHLRLKQNYSIGRIKPKVLHNTQHITLLYDLKKAYTYGNSLPAYLAKKHPKSLRYRMLALIRSFAKAGKEPLYAAGLIFIKIMEYTAGSTGFLVAKMGWKND